MGEKSRHGIRCGKFFEMRESRGKKIHLRASGRIEHVPWTGPSGVVELAAVTIGLVRISVW